jgi:alpha-beta hydrolase superfamily lysophospholipase
MLPLPAVQGSRGHRPAPSLFAGNGLITKQMKPNGTTIILFALFSAIYLLISGCGCCHDAPRIQPQGPLMAIDRIKADLRPLDFFRALLPTASIAGYIDFYRLDLDDAQHHFGTFQSGSETIAAQIFLPHDPKGTLFLIHGYLDHSATLKHLIKDGVKRGFAVAVFDLPGHGLSTGERGHINDFSEYAAALRDFLASCAADLPGPFHLIAHSTGCSIVYEYLIHFRQDPFHCVVFMAPLVHHSYWRLSTFGWRLAQPFVKTLPRINRRNSSDPDFLDFVKKDPLQNQTLSIAFLAALNSWNERIKKYHRLSRPVLIIQGSADTVVDWKYNIGFFKTAIGPLEVQMVAGARHQLANESDALRVNIFNSVFEYIDRPAHARRIRNRSFHQQNGFHDTVVPSVGGQKTVERLKGGTEKDRHPDEFGPQG